MKARTLIIMLLFSGVLKAQTIKESFIIKVLPDNGWVLEFHKNGSYEYYHWSGLGSGTLLNKGIYTMKNGLLSLQSIEKDSLYNNEIPSKLYYRRISKKRFEKIERSVFAIKKKRVLFRTRYAVLTEFKLKKLSKKINE